jgi:uncharacterized protein (TIGR02466 family)
MIEHKIIELFPKPILVADNICTDKLDQFEFIIHDIMKQKGTATTEFQHVKSTHATMCDLFNVVQFQPLIKEIQNFSYIFLESLGYSEQSISAMRLKQMWANSSNQYDYLFPHIHSNSVISGSFYIKSSDTDYIQFYNDVTDTTLVPENPTTTTQRVVDYPCKAGRLILFKSNLLHGTTIKKDMNEKIVMSFNIGL